MIVIVQTGLVLESPHLLGEQVRNWQPFSGKGQVILLSLPAMVSVAAIIGHPYFWVEHLWMQRVNCIYCTVPFYIRDLSICGFWYMKGLLEPISCRYRGTIVLNSGTVKTAWDSIPMSIAIWPAGHSLQTTGLGRYSPVLYFFGLKFLMYLHFKAIWKVFWYVLWGDNLN